MKLIDLKIDGFGKLDDRHVEFGPGINVVYGVNETGKSTLHACLRAMLYGMPREKGIKAQTDTWSRYKPWKNELYGGKLRVESDGKIYSIKRDFNEDPVGCVIVDESDGSTVENPELFLKEALGGISQKAYDSTISIGQLQVAAKDEMPEVIREFIVNLDTTGNHALNCDKALSKLVLQRNELAEEIDPNAARDYAKNAAEIKNLEAELKDPVYANNVFRIENELKAVQKLIVENEDSRQDISALIFEKKNYLSEKHFTTKAEIIEDRKKFEAEKEEYETELASGKRTILKVFCIIFFVLGIGAAGFFAYEWFAAPYFLLNENLILICGGLGGLFILAGIIFLLLYNSAVKKLRIKEEHFKEYLKNLGSGYEISRDNVDAVRSNFDELISVAEEIERKSEELTGLNKEYDNLTHRSKLTEMNLEKEKNTQKLLMEKISHLNMLRSENESLKAILSNNESVNDELEAIDIAMEKLHELSEKMRDSFGLFLNRNASEYVKGITGGIYDSMCIDDNLNVFMNTRDKMVPVEHVSGGTGDQIYLAMRLASASLIQGGSFRLPMIFDDSFVNYDSDRLTNALTWIASTFDDQIIIFSCHRREGEILRDAGIEFTDVIL